MKMKGMKKIALSFVLLSVALAARAAEPRLLTLDEALRLAGEHSPAARALDRSIDRARAAVPASGLWENPELALTREESAGVVERFATLSQKLPLGGRAGLERDAAESGLAAADASARQERVLLLGEVRAAFINLLLAQEQAAILETHRDRLASLAQAMRAREREGESSGFDRRRVAWEAAEAEALVSGARGDLAVARAALGALVGPPAENLRASGDLAQQLAVPERTALSALVLARGDLLALDAEAERADRLALAARRRAIPEPSITAGAKNTEAAGLDDTGLVVGLSIPLPFLDRGQASRVAAAEAAALRARREALAQRATAETESAWASVASRREAEAAYAGDESPDDLIRIARAAYDGGALRLLELIDAYRTAAGVRLRMAELHAGARRAEANLLTLAGEGGTR